jgi:phospholipid/cholesterol/gamma-HCH transport system ATP-binding protein
VADQIFLLADGRVVVQGTPKIMENSENPYAAQFIHAKAEGPVPFHMPAPALSVELDLAAFHSNQNP